MRVVTAVAVGDRGQKPVTVLARGEVNLRNARKAPAQFTGVGADRRAEFMKPDLLVKTRITFRPFAGPRIACVKNARAIGIPRGAPAAGRKLDAGNEVRQRAARDGLEKMQHPVFTAILRETNGHEPAICGGDRPVHRGGAIRVPGVGIKHDLAQRGRIN